MKKIGLIITGLFLLPISIFAQQKAEVKLSVHLADFHSITVNPNQEEVGLFVVEPEDFYIGTSVDQKNHLEISSTSEYEVKVSTSSELEGEGGSIPVNTVSLRPAVSEGGKTLSHPVDMNEIALSTGAQTIIHSRKGEMGRNFNMNYAISGGAEYMDKPEGTYSTTVSYIMLPR